MGWLRIRALLIFFLFLLSAIAFLDRTNISIAGVQISSEYRLGNMHLGWVFSAFLIGYAAFQIPAGWLAVRFGPRRVLAAGVLWWGRFHGDDCHGARWSGTRAVVADCCALCSRCR